MIEISRRSADDSHPYENLLPIVDFLVAHGNSVRDGGFTLTKGGWECRMTGPLDTALIRRNFQFPRNVSMDAATDSILDELTWCVIEGPGAHKTPVDSSRKAGDPHPFSRLMPIVGFLVANGNSLRDGGIQMDSGGWRCRMTGPLDFGLIRQNLDLPAGVILSSDSDSILDRETGAVIEGPGAHLPVRSANSPAPPRTWAVAASGPDRPAR